MTILHRRFRTVCLAPELIDSITSIAMTDDGAMKLGCGLCEGFNKGGGEDGGGNELAACGLHGKFGSVKG
jgi:hypothetical protein